jgi:uncharacterized protein (TIGR03066 family)
MALLRAALAGCLLLAAAPDGLAQKGKIDKAKLIGTWTFVKTTSKRTPPPGVTIKLEFTKDGKLNVTHSAEGKTAKATGTYTLKGDQLTTEMTSTEAVGGKPVTRRRKQTVTITELTDKRLVAVGKEEGKKVTTEFKK